MEEARACMVTGHRKIDVDKINFVKSALFQNVMLEIEKGCSHFISGFAEGVDLWFANVVAELKQTYCIKLEAAIPYQNRTCTKDKEFQCLLKQCDIISVYSDKYTRSCFMNRNRIMVECSDSVIVVYDGRKKGGTFATMRYAYNMSREIHMIKI